MVAQEIVDLANARLAGYQNAVEPSVLMSYVNEGKDCVWNLLKDLDKEFFMQVSQSTTPSASSYFAPLTSAAREYTLPSDCRSLEFIECRTSDYQTAEFIYAELNSEDFKQLRRAGAIPGTNNSASLRFLYTILGKDQFVLAQYPPTTLTLRLWYVRSIPDYESDTVVDDIVFPYAKLIANYAVQRAMLSIQDPTQFTLWLASWKEDVKMMCQGAGDRDTSGPLFVEDFLG